jgi:hypothetical protein
VILEPETCTIRHEKPICAEYTRRMEAAGMTARVDPWVVIVDPSTGKIVEPAKA